uniref:Uncharacterized protein n=1 Tax=Ditylenchus dipsaci TaxID=166011 RepID=A0A915E7G5_9BILA
MSASQVLLLTLVLVVAVFAQETCHSNFDCLYEMKMCIGGVCRYPRGSYRALVPAGCFNSVDCPSALRDVSTVFAQFQKNLHTINGKLWKKMPLFED